MGSQEQKNGRTTSHRIASFITVVCLTGLSVGARAGVVTYDTRALTGDAAVGAGPGVVYSNFSFTSQSPVLNGAGQTAFVRLLAGAGVNGSNNTVIWSEGSGMLGLVAREGDAAAGVDDGAMYSRFLRPFLNGAGQTAFMSILTGTGVDASNDRGIWSEGSGTLGLVAREGDAAAGTDDGVVYRDLVHTPVLNGAGQTAFFGSLTGTGVDASNDHGIWLEGGGTLGLVVRTGDVAAGTGDGVVYRDLGPPTLNGAGQIAFSGSLTGLDASNDHGIWLEGGGTLGLVVRTGDVAAGTGDGVVYRDLGSPILNGAGQIAFSGSLTGPGVNTSNDRGIWSEGSGTLALIAREGDTAAGTGAGVVYSSFTSIALNSAGQTAFSGYLTGSGVNTSNNEGIWSEGSGTLELVARKGDAAAGTGAGVVYSSFHGRRPSLNGAGQIAFTGFLTGPGVDASNRVGLWATDLDGLLHLIVRAGDLFDVNDDPLLEDLRTIWFVNFLTTGSGGEDGRRTSFNDAGQFVFRLNFTDGTEGVFVATVPEPGSLALLGLGGLAFLKRRRR